MLPISRKDLLLVGLGIAALNDLSVIPRLVRFIANLL